MTTSKKLILASVPLLFACGVVVYTLKSDDTAGERAAADGSRGGQGESLAESGDGNAPRFRTRTRADREDPLEAKYGKTGAWQARKITTATLDLMGTMFERPFRRPTGDFVLGAELWGGLNPAQAATITAALDEWGERRKTAQATALEAIRQDGNAVAEAYLAGADLKAGKITQEQYEEAMSAFRERLAKVDPSGLAFAESCGPLDDEKVGSVIGGALTPAQTEKYRDRRRAKEESLAAIKADGGVPLAELSGNNFLYGLVRGDGRGKTLDTAGEDIEMFSMASKLDDHLDKRRKNGE